MVDVLPTDRLTRKRNSNLQKQLEVTLQILTEEYRQTKERLYKDERECGQFLQSLHHTVPGLQSYFQPDTRAMNTNAMLKERRYSVSLHSAIDSDSDDDTPLKRLAAAGIYPDTMRLRGGHKAPGRPQGVPEGKALKEERAGGGGMGQGRDAFRRPGSSVGPGTAQRNNASVTGGGLLTGGRSSVRPSTAGPGGRRPVTAPAGDRTHANKKRPATGFDSRDRDVSKRFGKNVYTEHDREVHDQILNKFQHIFDPNTPPRAVKLTPKATPIVVVDPNARSQGGNLISQATPVVVVGPENSASSGKLTNGTLSKDENISKKLPGSRRVVWSARPAGRRPGVAARLPGSARERRAPSPQIQSTGYTQTPKQSSSTHSPAQTQTSGGFSTTFKQPNSTHSAPQRPPLRVEGAVGLNGSSSSIRAASACSVRDQRSLSPISQASSKESTTGMPSSVRENRGQSPTRSTTPASIVRPSSALSKGDDGKQAPAPTKHAHFPSSIRPLGPQPPNSGHHFSNAAQNLDASSSQHLLNIPEEHQHAQNRDSHHARNFHQLGGPPPVTHSKHAHAHPPRPASRMSEASDMTHNPDFVNKLLHAGEKAGEKKRPNPAPPKYELSVRSIPAPRQTVVGILSQIENRKADMRTMLKTSKELQKVVKKLVPWEKMVDRSSDDDEEE